MSLTLKSKDPQKIMQHVYYCLGKESIPYQDLVFFMAYELKLFSPTNCQKILAIGKEGGLVKISTGKVVTFNVSKLEGDGSPAKGPVPVLNILKELSPGEMMTKSVLIKDDQVLDFNHDPGKKVVKATFSGKNDINLSLVIDGKKKEILQEHEGDLGDLEGKKLFYKYFIKMVLKHERDPGITRLVREIHSNLDQWTFVYKKIEK